MELETEVEELGFATQEPCPVCGTTEFVQDGGFLYCSLCNTQSQISRLYVTDEVFNAESQQRLTRAAVLREGRGKKSKEKDKVDSKRKLSTWELWNIVLKIMADRLIEIGFPEVIRAKILQIYVTFMIKRKVIFVSTSNPFARSQVSVGEPTTNLQTLSGIRKPKRVIRRKRKIILSKKIATVKGGDQIAGDGPESISFSSRKQMKTVGKRKAMEKDYLTKEKGPPEADEREFEKIIDQDTRRKSQQSADGTEVEPKKLNLYTESSKKMLSQLGSHTSHRNRIIKKYHRKLEKATKLERFTYHSCFITVFVALRELGFPIVMADIARMLTVGTLRVEYTLVQEIINKVKEYEDAVVDPSVKALFDFKMQMFPLIQNCNEHVENFVTFIQLQKFHYPEMKEIVPKYIDEFVLPREFECLVNLINHMFPFNNYVEDIPGLQLERYRAVPEIIVLVQFIVVLKMLFGLDDKTEKFQAEFAKLVNKVVIEEVEKREWKMEDWTELFVIEDWFGYLQRRRGVVRRELCSPAMYTFNKPPSLVKLNDLMKKASLEDDESEVTPQEEAAKSCKALFETILKESLSSRDENPEIPILKPYIPLPLPSESIARQYVERYPLVGDPSVKPELLKADFVQKRLDFIWNPQKYKKLLKSKGYKVKIIHGDAVNNFPVELSKEVAESKVVLLFQPYKKFDEFIGKYRENCSCSAKFVLELCEDILPGVEPERNSLEPLLQKLVNAVGDMYIKRVLLDLIPIMSRWSESESD